MIKLTKMEKMVLNALRDNDYEDALEGGTWLFVATEYSGLDTKQARGALSSLIKKELVEVNIDRPKHRSASDESMIWFTEKGKQLFDNADGEECSWGGPRLLKEEDDTEEVTIENKEEKDMTTMTVKELREEAKARGLKGISRMKKEELLALMSGESASEEVEVEMYAFTGMYIGKFTAVKKNGWFYVKTKAGKELEFDACMNEITVPGKERYANRIKAC